MNFTGVNSPNFLETFTNDTGLVTTLNALAGGSFAGVTGGLITLEATDITVASAFNLNTATGQHNVSLVLQAQDSITILAPIVADGTGTITISAHDTAPSGLGVVTISAPITADAAISISGASIVLTDTVETLGPITINGLGNPLDLSGGTLEISGTTVTISNATTLNLGTVLASSATLSLTTTDDITQAGLLNIANLTGTSGGVINLNNRSNQIAAVGSLSSAGDLTLRDSVALEVDGPVSDSVSGSTVSIVVTRFALTLAGDISTTDGDIDLGAVGISQTSGTLSSGAGTVTLNGGTGAVSLASDITTTGGDINVSGTGIGQSVGTLDSGTGAITLNGNSAAVSLFGSLTSADAGAAITISGATTLGLGTTTASSGSLSLSASDDITQNGVANVANLTATGGGIIQLDNGSNLIAAVGAIDRGGRLTIDDTEALIVNGPITGTTTNSVIIDVSGALLTLASDITTTGAAHGINLTGTGIMQSSGTLDAGAGTITLDGNSAAVSLSGSLKSTNTGTAITISGATTLGLGTITAASGTLSLSLRHDLAKRRAGCLYSDRQRRRSDRS